MVQLSSETHGPYLEEGLFVHCHTWPVMESCVGGVFQVNAWLAPVSRSELTGPRILEILSTGDICSYSTIQINHKTHNTCEFCFTLLKRLFILKMHSRCGLKLNILISIRSVYKVIKIVSFLLLLKMHWSILAFTNPYENNILINILYK